MKAVFLWPAGLFSGARIPPARAGCRAHQPMNKLPQILKTTLVAQSRLFYIEAVDLRFANGQQANFERLVGRGTGVVLVVPLVDADNLLLVREYAVGLERYELGFVKGRIDAGESAAAAAHRELREETGFDAVRMKLLANVALTPAYSNYCSSIFLAQDLFRAPLPGDEPEPLQAVHWPLAKLGQLRAREDFCDARSLLATYLAREALEAHA